VWITSSLKAAKAPTTIALGNFDGVHLGHLQVMAQIMGDPALDEGLPNEPAAMQLDSLEARQFAAIPPALSQTAITTLHRSFEALENLPALSIAPVAEPSAQIAAGTSTGVRISTDLSLNATIKEGEAGPENQIYPQATGSAPHKLAPPPAPHKTVVTFSPHPQEYFSGQARPLLTPLAEKAWQLAQLGIDQMVTLPFNEAIAQLSPEEFVEQILLSELQAKRISVGSDFRFGKGRSGDADTLQAIAQTHGVPVVQVPLKYKQGDRISSSRIRLALQTGQIGTATQLLGRRYLLTGRVVQGQQLGRTLGFPTANLQLPAQKYLPGLGVYSVRVYGAAPEPLMGVMNIGRRPTVQGQNLSVEVHILNWAGDLYGKLLTVSLESFIRTEQAFDSLNQLKAQIEQDCQRAIAILS
jgi:riboflavin kinase / FMN adenylyltransferase